MVRASCRECRDLLAGPEGKPAEPLRMHTSRSGPITRDLPAQGALGPVEACGPSHRDGRSTHPVCGAGQTNTSRPEPTASLTGAVTAPARHVTARRPALIEYRLTLH